MNTPNPLVPQGSAPAVKGKPNIRLAVFTILAIHIVLLGALLMQGCKPDPASQLRSTSTTNDLAFPSLSDSNYMTNTVVAVPEVSNGAPVSTVVPTPSTPAVEPAPFTPVPQAGELIEYSVVKGDTLSSIAKRHHVGVQAIIDANPGINPNRLQPKQKILVPQRAPASVSAAGTSTASEKNGSTELYTVRPGDTLSTIAKNHQTSVKAIKALNGLKTDQLRPGKKLKLPAPKPATEGATAPESSGSGATPTDPGGFSVPTTSGGLR